MITREQASTVAELLLAQERQRLVDARNAKARRLPPYFRVDELRGFQPWEQVELLEAAEKSARSRPVLVARSLAWLVLCGLVWHLLGGPAHTPGLVLFLGLGAAGVAAMRVKLVRSELRRLAQSGASSRPGQAAPVD